MGAGRKTTTHHLKEKVVASYAANSSAPARNLAKKNLGGVIFGCKNYTISECHAKMLFGLPQPHFAYVKNIHPGMPLFLFNYSDRNLHGIYEATSHGKMNIDLHAWTTKAGENTLYGAQVKIKDRTPCLPLSEEEFGLIIHANYYEEKLFWFELDNAQTEKLINMFKSRTCISRPLFPPSDKGQKRNKNAKAQTSHTTIAPPDLVNEELGGSWDHLGFVETENNILDRKPEKSYSAIASGVETSFPPKPVILPGRKWSSLFQSSSSLEKQSIEGQNPVRASETYGGEWGVQPLDTSCKASTGDEDWGMKDFSTSGKVQTGNADSGVQDFGTYEAPVDDEEKYSLSWLDDDVSWDRSDVIIPDPHTSCEAPAGSDRRHGAPADENWSSSSRTTFHSDRDVRSESFADEEPLQTEENTEVSYSSAVEIDIIDNQEEKSKSYWGNKSSSDIVETADMAPPGIQALVVKLMAEVEALKVSHQMISGELIESKAQIQMLKSRFHKLESGSYIEPRQEINDAIFIIGGFDGSSWLPDLCSYLPLEDILTPLSPMSVVRKYSAAVTLNGEVYVLGGEYGSLWQDTVESYNPVTDKWSNRPSLNRQKGSLAGVPLFDRIYAIGGGDGKNCFSDVEMLDFDVGKWIPTRSMAHKRFAPAAAELNGALYVVGGYDGESYLSSTERFDPREHSWKSVASMGTKRGCHSLISLNNKLYAIGGHSGAGMVSSVEIFEPRTVSWMTGQPMTMPRGYFGAAVLKEKIHIIGGMTENDEILGTIEVYEEGRGWEMTELKAVGRRCYLSAIVL